MRTKSIAERIRLIDSENKNWLINTINACYATLTEPNQTGSDIKSLSILVDDGN